MNIPPIFLFTCSRAYSGVRTKYDFGCAAAPFTSPAVSDHGHNTVSVFVPVFHGLVTAFVSDCFSFAAMRAIRSRAGDAPTSFNGMFLRVNKAKYRSPLSACAAFSISLTV